MIIEGEVGPQGPNQDGTNQTPRLDRYGSVVVVDGAAHFAESVYRGNVFTACATALTPGTALGTSAPLALYNPAGSGKVLSVLRVGFAWWANTLGAGKMWYVAHAIGSAVPGGTKLVPVGNNGTATSGVGQAFSSATGLGTQTGIRPFATVTALTADAGTSGLPVDQLLDGEIGVAPGGAFSIQEVGAVGTNPEIAAFITWMELPA